MANQIQLPTAAGSNNGAENNTATDADATAVPGTETEISEYTSGDALINALLKRRRKSLALKLSEEQKRRLADRVIQDFSNAHSAQKDFLRNHLQFIKNWRSITEPKPNGPIGKKSANVKVPLTGPFIEQWKARVSEAVIGGDRIAEFESLDASLYEKDQLTDLSDWFDWELKNIIGIEAILEEIAHYTLLDGWALPIASWEREKQILFTTREFELSDTLELEDQMNLALSDLFKGDEIIDQVIIDQGVYDITLRSHKQDLKPTRVTFLLEEDTLVVELEKEEFIFDGVRVVIPSIEDTIIVNSHWDVEKIPFFGTRFFMSVTEFKRHARKGGFFEGLDKDSTDKVISFANDKRSDYLRQDISDELDLEEGTDSTAVQFSGDEDRMWVEIYRWESTITIGTRMYNVVAWVDAKAYVLLKIMRLEELNKDGKRSPVKFDFIKQYGRFYSIGLAEWIRHSQEVMDGVYNQRLDSGLISTVPFGFYTPAAGQPKNIIQLEAGMLYPVKDANAINFPKIGANLTWGFEEEALARKYASEAAGVGDPGLGTFTSKRLSAVEFSGTANAIELRTAMIVRGFMRSMTTLLERIFGLYQQFAKSSRLFQVTTLEGEHLVKSLATDRLHGKVKLRLTGNIQQISQQMEREMATNMLSLLLNGILIQMGIVKPSTVYTALKRVMRAMHIRGVQIYPPTDPPMSLPPNEEHKAMQRGETVEPALSENFDEHLAVHVKLASNPNINQLMPDPFSRNELQRHIQTTVQMQQQAKMIRQIQAAQALQMQQGMASMGIRPGMAGQSTPGAQATPATQQEGVPNAPPEQMGGNYS